MCVARSIVKLFIRGVNGAQRACGDKGLFFCTSCVSKNVGRIYFLRSQDAGGNWWGVCGAVGLKYKPFLSRFFCANGWLIIVYFLGESVLDRVEMHFLLCIGLPSRVFFCVWLPFLQWKEGKRYCRVYNHLLICFFFVKTCPCCTFWTSGKERVSVVVGFIFSLFVVYGNVYSIKMGDAWIKRGLTQESLYIKRERMWLVR